MFKWIPYTDDRANFALNVGAATATLVAVIAWKFGKRNMDIVVYVILGLILGTHVGKNLYEPSNAEPQHRPSKP